MKCKELSFLILFLLVPFVFADLGKIEEAQQEVRALGYETPYFDAKLVEAASLADNEEALEELTKEVVLHKQKIISLIGLERSLVEVIRANQYALDTGMLHRLLNQNDVDAAEAELNRLVEEISRIESGKALGGLVNTVSLADRFKDFLNTYKYALLGLLLFFVLLAFLFYKALRYRYLQFRIRHFKDELEELDLLEKELQNLYYNKKKISKADFSLKNEQYLARKLELEESLIEFQDKLRE